LYDFIIFKIRFKAVVYYVYDVLSVFGASSALEELCDNALYKLTLTLTYRK